MNQAQKSAVKRINQTSVEYSALQSICGHTTDKNISNSVAATWDTYRKVLLNVKAKVNVWYKVHILRCF